MSLSFQTEKVGEDNDAALSLLDPTCVDSGENIFFSNSSYNSSAFNFLVGDFWPNPEQVFLRYASHKYYKATYLISA